MKKIFSAVRIMRLPNVIIIIITMALLRYGLIKPFLFEGQAFMMSDWLDFSLLVLATVLISVGGYVINDLFDSGMDAINKPGKNSIGVDFTKRSATFMYRIVNAIALLIGIYLAIKIKSLTFGLIFPFVIYLLWLYSARYKKLLVWGNIIVAMLSTLVIFMVWYYEFQNMVLDPAVFTFALPNLKNLNIFFLMYGGFAFLVTLLREIIKDIEDKKGDEVYNCRTIVIAWGERTAQYITTGLILITILLVVWFQQILLNRGWNSAVWYFIIAVQVPLVYLAIKIYLSKNPEDYHFLSSLTKIVMFAGIISIQLIYTSL